MSRENSALIALAELKNLEAQRVRKVEDEEQAKQAAERREREQRERIRLEAQERVRHEREQRARVEQEERERKQREERIRVAEAEARSRAEAEARLREEQMRLDAQVKMAERKKTPYWLYATAGLLVVGLIGGGALFVHKRSQDQLENQRIAQQLADKKAELEALEDKANKLEQDMTDNEAKQADLERALLSAKDQVERERIQAELDEKQREKERLGEKLADTNRRRGGSKAGKRPPAEKQGRERPLVLKTGTDPLHDDD